MINQGYKKQATGVLELVIKIENETATVFSHFLFCDDLKCSYHDKQFNLNALNKTT
jgi:hypothetical protein